MHGPERVHPEQVSRHHLYGVCFLEEVPRPFTAMLWQEGSNWRGRLETWGDESIRPHVGNRATLIDVIHDQGQRSLQFTMYDASVRRELRFTLEKMHLDDSWIGTCAYLSQPEQKYPARCKTMFLFGDWFNRERLLQQLQMNADTRRTQAKERVSAPKASDGALLATIIRGAYPLMPKQAPDDLSCTFGSAEIETSAERLIVYCRQRPSVDGSGSWDPFSREEFEQFCVAQKFADPFKLGWLDGLLDPIRDYYSTYGGDYVVVQPDGLIGVTERFVQALMRKLQKTV